MKKTPVIALIVLAWAAAAPAGLTVQRWGKYKYTQHKDVTFQAGNPATLTVNLAPVGKSGVSRARLVILGGQGYEVAAGEKALKLVEPYGLWFDATEAVAGWVRAGQAKAVLTIKGNRRLKAEQVYLEIAYEGAPADPPQQVTGLKACHHHGQTFLTWTEIEDLAEGDAEITWGKMVKKVRACNPMVGITPKWPDREIRYSVYRHTEPITAKNIARAEFVHDAMQGAVYIEDRIARGKKGEHGPTFLIAGQVLRRVGLEKNKMLPPGTGFHWTTAAKAGKAYYAVVTSVNGVENTSQISQANAVGPVDEKVAQPVPMLVAEKVTDLRGRQKRQYVERWYSWWCTQPLSAYPRRYDVAIGFCPQALVKPAPVSISRGAWNYSVRMPRPSAGGSIVLCHTMDVPIAFRMGPNDCHHTLKSHRQGKWRPWPMRRQEALIDWLASQFPIDRDFVSVGMGAWGMMEIERPDLYASVHGWGQPGMTEGFQCWNRARGVWGPPETYEGRDDKWNPFKRARYDRYALADPGRETPFYDVYAIRSAHLTEMGWPPLPRFWRAMIDSRHPFVVHWRIRTGRPVIRRNQSVPAFGNCTLDDNPGNGDLRNGLIFDTQINGYLSWKTETIVDEPDRWEMTVLLHKSAPLGECAVDLTPRKCQKFKPRKGQTYKWTCTTIPPNAEKLGSGTVTADQWNLVTIRQMRLVRGSQRVVIVRQ